MRFLERSAAFVQGKGYGTASIKKENAFVQKLLGYSPELAIDIGGNVGDYSAELRRRHPAVVIHVFEPSAKNVATLRRRFAGDSGITVMPFAVSDTEGSGTLYSDKLGSGLASLKRRRLDHRNIPFCESEPVQVIRFEDYWRDQLQERVCDIVKLDIEGVELSALEGFGVALLATQVVQWEFGGCNIDTRTFFQDFWYFFNDHHFDVWRIGPFGLEKLHKYREADEFFSTTNYIAVARRRRDCRQGNRTAERAARESDQRQEWA
jgi:FkbM family methyltransferase